MVDMAAAGRATFAAFRRHLSQLWRVLDQYKGRRTPTEA